MHPTIAAISPPEIPLLLLEIMGSMEEAID
jgi:hypothetical protein